MIFFFNDTATTEIYPLPLHDPLPISLHFELVGGADGDFRPEPLEGEEMGIHAPPADHIATRSEEHTSELQSRLHLVCRLLLEKKKHTRSCLLHITTYRVRFTVHLHAT